MPELTDCRVVLAHGAGSDGGFLTAAFPAEHLGARSVIPVEHRSGNLDEVTRRLQSACGQDRGPVVLGGVSIGAHAAARLLVRPPANVVAGLLCLPAWTGAPDAVADLTAAAAAAIAVLGPDQVLAELDPCDWVTPQLRRAWRLRQPDALAAELRTAAEQPGPDDDQLARIGVPVVVAGLRDDPLHPSRVAHHWSSVIPHSEQVWIGRREPDRDLAVFARRCGPALRRVLAPVTARGR